MRGFTAGTAHRRDSVTPYIEIWEQPFSRWLIATSYQLWESLSFQFMVQASKWHRHFFYKNHDYVPLTARQDIRCHELIHRKRRRLAIAYITQEQFDVIIGATPQIEEPRHEVKSPIIPDGEIS